MKYEDMSDFEINKAVAWALGCIEIIDGYDTEVVGEVLYCIDEKRVMHQCFQDYCNNPSDAWPIVQLIWWKLFEVDNVGVVYWNRFLDNESDALRAAMIVFLMMKEGEV